jgi:gliding motility-associated-like protein
LIAEVFREIQLISRACANNDLPSYVPPPELNTTPVDNLYSITATAGDLVQFSITATDSVINNLGGNLFLEASGGAFGSLYSDPNIGCNFPPCATLNPPPPASGLETLTTIFTWQTACDHVMDVTSPPSIIDEECYTNQTYNTFQISFRDDFCPYPAYTNITISVIVEAPPLTPSPELRCLEVLPGSGGDVKLTWIPPPDPENQFEAYRIFRSSNASGPFTEIAFVNSLAQTSFTDLGAGANAAPVYYYISTLTGCAGNILNTPLDTLATMFVDFSADALGTIDVAWSELSVPLPASAQLPYELYKATNSSAPAYSLFSSPNLPEEQDAVSGCDQFVSYYVRLNDQSGCYSLSNVDSGRISTTAPPLAPVLDTVSVNPANNDVVIAWLSDTSPLADSIIIYRLDAGLWSKLDSTHHSDLSRVLTTQGPDVQSISYRITSRDLCKIEGPPSTEHETLHLSYELNQCDASVKLICNPYTAWQNEAVTYRVFSSENGGILQEVGAFAGTGTQFPQVRISGLLTGVNYCYFIRAENNASGKTSSSNQVCFNAAVDVPPDYTYVRTATVNPLGSVFTACLLDPTADINFYAVQRSNWPGSAFETLVTLPVIPGTPEVVFLDTTVNSAAQSYVYKFVVYNKCNEVSGVSNPARTMLLQGKADDGFVNRLLWNSYGEWDAQVFDYTVYRALGIEGNFEPIENTVTDTSYIDRVVDEVESNLTFCYIIKAYEGPGNSYGVRDSSWSNILCLTQQSTFYIPNAFVPGRNGANMIYKPKGLFESLSTNFKFSIYNRWGEQIFYTENPSEGWDGTYQSRQVNPDIFAVRITFQLPDGTEFKHTGSVLLLN